MSKRDKMYYAITSALFVVVGTLHATRAWYGWDMVIADVAIPVELSWAAALLLGYLAVRGVMALRRA